jgi:hypothetical protein
MTIAAVRLIRSMNGTEDPKESMTATGLLSKASNCVTGVVIDIRGSIGILFSLPMITDRLREFI